MVRVNIGLMALALFCTVLLMCGCGSEDKSATAGPEKFLIDSPSKVNLQRVGEIRTFEDKSLWEYINGGAELYYLYDFKSVATADYKHENTEVVVDIYQFGTPDYAYGIYSMFRSSDVDLIKLGVEGFIDPVSLTFIKDAYMIKLVGYDESMDMSLILTNLAEEIESVIPGVSQPPATFNDFPDSTVIPATGKLYAESYLGQKFLTDIYTQDYIIENDTVSLFYSDDKMGGKYLEWSKIAEKTNKKEAAPDDMPFDSDYGLIFKDSFYGQILVGLKDGKMFGLVGYNDSHAGFFSRWLKDSENN